MKIWIKYLIGIALGIVTAFVLPESYLQETGIVSFLSDIAIRTVRFLLVPLMFFSFTVAVFKLRDTKKFFKTLLISGIIIVSITVVFTILGLVAIFIVKLPRIPISADRVTQVATVNILENIKALFPYSGFESLINGTYLLPALILAGLLGIGCAVDKTDSKPTVALFDSLTKLCNSVMNFFIDIFAVGLVAVTSLWTFQFFEVLTSGIYNGLIILLFSILFLIAVVIYPLILYFVCKEPHPYRVLYASLGTLFAAFLSGDTNLTLALAMRHNRESLGIKRRSTSSVTPILAIFSRAGSALVVSISFIVIFRSYNALGISFHDIMWVAGFSIVSSFFLGALPTGSTFYALTLLCTMYGRGFEAGYLLLKPVAFILCSFAAAIDSLTMIFGTYIVSQKMKTTERQEIKYFI
ncbi:MAG: cation:dicarboxylase symporter family transporter [Treponemataceae bacterium]|nr:cation:dicarboxylase symporter family transporter [Treponemataceae bacterium]